MVDWSFGVFDVLFWLFALAVAYYVAFVLDIRHFFIRLKDEKNAKIRRRPDETEPLKLEKFYGCIVYNEASKVAEKLANQLKSDFQSRKVPLQTSSVEAFNFDSLDHFKRDYPIIFIIDGRCIELEKFLSTFNKDDGNQRAYCRSYLNNISYSSFSVEYANNSELDSQLARLGAKSLYQRRKEDNFLTWKDALFSNLNMKKCK